VSFDEGFTRVQRSVWLRTTFGAVLDPDLPADVEPFSFVPLQGLREVAAALQLNRGEALVDLACGRGGPGMWVARETGAVLVGVDGSEVGVGQARARAGLFGLEQTARFVVGDLAATGLPDACADGVMSIDAIQFAPDPLACAREVLRIVRPGRWFALTNWEPRRPGDPQVPDRFRDLQLAQVLTTAGFHAVEVHERPAWEVRTHAVFEAALAAGDPGQDDGLAMFQQDARAAGTWNKRCRRVLAVARRP
jgi:ubiquinone/menaquinone biosynthesis C-methylase UbiE